MKRSKLLKNIFIFILVILLANTMFANSQKLIGKAKTNFRSANLHYNGKRFKKALPLYLEVLKDNPNHIESLEKVASIYYADNKEYIKSNNYYLKANNEIQKIIDEYKQEIESNPKKSKKLNKKIDKFLKKFEHNQDMEKSCWAKIFIKGKSKFKDEQYDDAISIFNELLQIGPDSVNTVKMLAYCYMKKEDKDKELEYMIQAANLDLEDKQIRSNIAIIYFGKEDYQNAIKWYSEAAKLDSVDSNNYFNIGICYSRMKDDQNAYKFFKKVVELDPKNLDAVINVSNCASKLKMEDESITYLKMAVDLDKENIDYLSNLCYRLSKLKRWDELIEYAKKWEVLEKDSDASKLIKFANQNLKNKK